MIERCEDLFHDLNTPNHIIALSTNGTIKKNGQGVMGRGCALEAANRFPTLPLLLGLHLKSKGNVPTQLAVTAAITFMILPVKHEWHQQADVDLVIASVRYLEREAYDHGHLIYHVPRLGCGNGRLSWLLQVAHLMEPLPKNVIVHH